jgi:hypothetical protein
MKDQTATVKEGIDDSIWADSYFQEEAKMFSVYQNQENVVNAGWVNSYRLETTIWNSTNLTNPETSQFYYEFEYTDMTPRPFEKETRVVFFFLNVFSLVYWLVRNYQ